MALEDIERLKERVDKDPNSKLFIPLAEEYKKAGMFEEAIDVLTKGLERQPGYMSARVSLGKIFFERGMFEEARAEFEKVISTIPDNLYAHKKLAEIYRDLGEKDRAVKEFKTVLKLNPMDEWAATSLSDIEKEPKLRPKAPEKVKTAETILSEPSALKEPEEEKPSEVSIGEEVMEEVEEILPEAAEEVVEEVEEILPEAAEEVVEEVEEILPEAELEEAQIEPITEAEELPEEEPLSFESIFKEDVAVEEKIVKEDKVSEQPFLGIYDADPYISQGKYMEAMSVYRKLLSTEPDNVHVIQRVEELKSLLKLLGKDKEELIARLDSFLDGIKKRRDEFFGSA
jgi:tetratricopeptide (TPR) repeat protein